MQLNTVVLPAPFGPISAVILRRSALKEKVVDGDDAAEAHRQPIDGQDVIAAHPCPSLTRSDEIA